MQTETVPTQVTEVSTIEVDALLEKILSKREEYDAAKAVSTKLYKEVDALESQMIALMEKCGKTQWKIDGLGTASIVNTLSVPTPKTTQAKKLLWDYVLGKYGEEVAFDKFGMHSKTLNSFYKEEEKSADDPSLFSLPGVETPTYTHEFRFRKA